MFRRAPLASLSLAALTLVGCAHEVEDPGKFDEVVDLQDRSAEPTRSSTGEGTTQDGTTATYSAKPVYFNEANYLDRTPDQASSYVFDVLPDARIGIHLGRATETGPRHVGFTLYRATTNGQGRVVGHVEDDDGTADAELWSEHGGTYVIELLDGQSPASFVLTLTCRSEQCTKLRQPGQVCGFSEPNLCADGLVCRFADGMCKAGDTPARCQIPPSECSNVRAPVCGCDGKTWGNECFARVAGVSVLKNGECGAGK